MNPATNELFELTNADLLYMPVGLIAYASCKSNYSNEWCHVYTHHGTPVLFYYIVTDNLRVDEAHDIDCYKPFGAMLDKWPTFSGFFIDRGKRYDYTFYTKSDGNNDLSASTTKH